MSSPPRTHRMSTRTGPWAPLTRRQRPARRARFPRTLLRPSPVPRSPPPPGSSSASWCLFSPSGLSPRARSGRSDARVPRPPPPPPHAAAPVRPLGRPYTDLIRGR
eukprot:Amastigsp_a342105_12.p2 type:complete len:106 gc:universal Amastigsp_a342105_12:539-222(-)